MRRVVWAGRAVADLARIEAYVREFNPAAAARLADALIAASRSLGEHSDRGRGVGAAYRELAIVPPYLIRYRVTASEVVIVTIRHGARRPL